MLDAWPDKILSQWTFACVPNFTFNAPTAVATMNVDGALAYGSIGKQNVLLERLFLVYHRRLCSASLQVFPRSHSSAEKKFNPFTPKFKKVHSPNLLKKNCTSEGSENW